MKKKKGGGSGSKSWSNKEETVECGGQSVIQAVLETNHAGSWGHGGCFSSYFFVFREPWSSFDITVQEIRF